jgi:molecular chaperone GrpE (heat shock protein)
MGLENIFFAVVLWAVITVILFFWATPFYTQTESESTSIPPTPSVTTTDPAELEQLRQEIARLQEQLAAGKAQAEGDLKADTFETLQTLLVNYPSARRMADSNPNMPARNLSALFVPLENLLENWGYEPIGQVWEQVTYDPQIHQADEEDITEGENVYVRFIGYRDGDAILAPAKVSRTLPPGA